MPGLRTFVNLLGLVHSAHLCIIRPGEGLRAGPVDYAVLGTRLSASGKDCNSRVESCPISKRNSVG
jgi:hypothetical protein